MDGLREAKDARFQQTPVGVFVGFVPDGQALLGGIDRCPDIFADPLGTDSPPVVEQFDIAGAVDLAHDMDPPCRDGQATYRDQTAQVGGQAPDRLTSAHLRGCLAV